MYNVIAMEYYSGYTLGRWELILPFNPYAKKKNSSYHGFQDTAFYTCKNAEEKEARRIIAQEALNRAVAKYDALPRF